MWVLSLLPGGVPRAGAALRSHSLNCKKWMREAGGERNIPLLCKFNVGPLLAEAAVASESLGVDPHSCSSSCTGSANLSE